MANQTKAKGYVVDNLGLPVWLVNLLKEKYPGRSIHFAIQQELKENLTK